MPGLDRSRQRAGIGRLLMRAVAAFPPYADPYAARPKRPVVGNHRAPIPTAPRSSATGGPSGTSRNPQDLKALGDTNDGWRGTALPADEGREGSSPRPGWAGSWRPSGSSPSETSPSARDGVLTLGRWLTLVRTVLLNFDEW